MASGVSKEGNQPGIGGNSRTSIGRGEWRILIDPGEMLRRSSKLGRFAWAKCTNAAPERAAFAIRTVTGLPCVSRPMVFAIVPYSGCPGRCFSVEIRSLAVTLARVPASFIGLAEESGSLNSSLALW